MNYDPLNSIGAVYLGNDRCHFRVWAPFAKSLDVRIVEPSERVVPLEPGEFGYFSATIDGVPPGTLYRYRLDHSKELPDPISRSQPQGVHGPSQVVSHDFDWSEKDWKGLPLANYVLYELHVATFTREGTFEAMISRLPQLKELGVTAIEVMPVAQFPGTRGWGYDGVYPFAVQTSYGGPEGLKRFVNAAHREGLAVVLDVVYNHFGPEGNYFGEFGPYFTQRYRTPWGQALNFDARSSDPVRLMVLENVRQWVRDYRMDGLRLDAVHAIYDFSARHLLREIKEAADDEASRLGRTVQVIAESNLNDVRLLQPTDRGGYGLDAQWSDDFHHCVHTMLTGERDGYYADFTRTDQLVKALNSTFVFDGNYSHYRGRKHGAPIGELSGERFVISIQNHDQIGNRAMGDRFGTLLSPAKQRLAAALMLLAPNVPLLFMGEEYGESSPFPFFCSFLDPQLIEAVRKGRREEFATFEWKGEIPDPHAESTFESARLNWSWPEGSWQAGLRDWYRDLLAARRNWPALRDFQNRRARLLDDTGDPGVLQLVRGNKDTPESLFAYFNLGSNPQPIDKHTRGSGKLLISSRLPRYDPGVTSDAISGSLQGFEVRVFGRK